ncbi:DNA polymerase III subunit chi [Mesosutterella sp. OilRF-GAM-744-9]|uniref:DNA polymerase III subunit chi n=1 Tax=Mesosutterella porci TaxID=2915351 RepID=A0ABS9MSI1_9BURK|nr:DNA polymerase III subunit chi [Mesosutterella sp. oilRF-744-WT-GAM-9]MCG5031342.1 DNA polymerase III subunit chi [Mesosutterella sp. oilRF-744-WT-GAM-9]
MQQIDFHFNVGSRLQYACLFVRKVWKMGKSVAVWSSDSARLADFNRRLWAFDDLSFVPHAMAGSQDAQEARVVLSEDPSRLPDSDVLLLLDESVPPDFEQLFRRFDRVVDIVSSVPEETAAARARYKIYRKLNCPLKAYDQGSR